MNPIIIYLLPILHSHMILNQFILLFHIYLQLIFNQKYYKLPSHPEKLDGIKFNFCIFIIKDFLLLFYEIYSNLKLNKN